MNKLFKILFSRFIIVCMLILLQLFFLITLINGLSIYYNYVNLFLYIFSLIIVIYIINKDVSPEFKLPWITLTVLFPVFGGLFYVLFRNNTMRKKFIENAKKQSYDMSAVQKIDGEVFANLLEDDRRIYQQSKYIYKVCNMPVYGNTESKYLKIGEEYFSVLIEELKKAKEFIFIESFIIQEGKMWNSVLDILIEKVKQGVEVRVMYDDLGTINTLPNKYHKKLKNLGIKCIVFNPFLPIVSIGHNNRDHRKIIVIDGTVGFTGGINFADEYINEKLRFGHWKDTGIIIKGEAVSNLTLMFLSLWHHYIDENEDYSKYIPQNIKDNYVTDGYVQPYMDGPMDSEDIGKNIYINILNNATEYVQITTPYLIIDYSLMESLINAAKRGVNIKIITPHIPDKWYIHIVTQSYYLPLIEAGISIYEYTPGFIHSKSFVCDDEICTIGTINLDYRSLYHHYECGIWLYKASCLFDVKNDFFDTLNISKEITKEYCHNIPLFKRILSEIFKFFAPLL